MTTQGKRVEMKLRGKEGRKEDVAAVAEAPPPPAAGGDHSPVPQG